MFPIWKPAPGNGDPSLARIQEPNTNLISCKLATSLGPVYTGPDKFGTGPLRDLIGSVPKRSHESCLRLHGTR